MNGITAAALPLRRVVKPASITRLAERIRAELVVVRQLALTPSTGTLLPRPGTQRGLGQHSAPDAWLGADRERAYAVCVAELTPDNCVAEIRK